jgi:hypothetical protein
LEGTNVVGGALQSDNPLDQLLAASAAPVQRLRAALFRELNYTISAGISHNRMLAKIASSRFKPNQQTIICAKSAPSIMAEQAIRSVPGFGGKLGSRIAAVVLTSPTVAAAMPEKVAASLGPAAAAGVQPIAAGCAAGGAAVRAQPIAAASFTSNTAGDVGAVVVPNWERPKTASTGAKVTVAMLQATALRELEAVFGKEQAAWIADIAQGTSSLARCRQTVGAGRCDSASLRAELPSLALFMQYRACLLINLLPYAAVASHHRQALIRRR